MKPQNEISWSSRKPRCTSVLQFAIFISAALCLCGEGRAQTQAVPSSRPSVVTTNHIVENQTRRTFAFETGVFISNDFDGARLNNIVPTGSNSFTATIGPENFPINESAWYAFKVWSKSNQTISIKLTYPHGKHRYAPKLSHDGETWQKLDRADCAVEAKGAAATLHLQVGPKPVFIAGQELFTEKKFDLWIAEMCRNSFVHSKVIGKSERGKPIQRLIISEAKNPEYLIILSRQHPPEVTGTFALKTFLDTILADTDLAKRFRKQFAVVVVPLANPDGVAAGHWRHNANGVDLNRDWGQFNQAETRVLRDEFLRVQKESGGKVLMGLDFHSTQHDVFYTTEGSAPGKENFVERWLTEVQSAMPDYKVNIEPSKNLVERATLTSAAWMNRQFNIPAVTYEVGDGTDRKLIDRVASTSATALMKLFLESATGKSAVGN